MYMFSIAVDLLVIWVFGVCFFFRLLSKCTFISEATWCRLTQRRSVTSASQRSSRVGQLVGAPRFCYLAPPRDPLLLSYSWSWETRTLEDAVLLFTATSVQCSSSYWIFSKWANASDVANAMRCKQMLSDSAESSGLCVFVLCQRFWIIYY